MGRSKAGAEARKARREEIQQRAAPKAVQKVPKQVRIYEDRVEWDGFGNIYEALGFIDIHCQPQRLKQVVVEAAQARVQQPQIAQPAPQPTSEPSKA